MFLYHFKQHIHGANMYRWINEIEKLVEEEFGGYCKVVRKKPLGVKNGYEIAEIDIECIQPIYYHDLERFRNKLEEKIGLAIDPGDIELYAPWNKDQLEKLGYGLFIHVKAYKPK